MNVQFVRAGITPIYIKVEDKKDYVAALSRADQCGDYDELYEIVFKLIIKSLEEHMIYFGANTMCFLPSFNYCLQNCEISSDFIDSIVRFCYP